MAVHSDNAGVASSLTDLMTSLAVIFILLLVASHNNEQHKFMTTRESLEDAKRDLEAAREKLDAAQRRTDITRYEILVALRRALENFAAQGVRTETDPHDPLGLLVLVPEGLLQFAVDQDKIPPDGEKFLQGFIPKLATTVCSDLFKDEINAMVIEGHTDSSGSDTINLPLSQARSMAVVRKSLSVLSGMPERSCFLDFLSASGRGSREPILGPAGNEDLARSRRVVFKIRIRSLEQRQLQETLGILHQAGTP